MGKFLHLLFDYDNAIMIITKIGQPIYTDRILDGNFVTPN